MARDIHRASHIAEQAKTHNTFPSVEHPRPYNQLRVIAEELAQRKADIIADAEEKAQAQE